MLFSLGLPAVAFVIIFVARRRALNQERMALIEKGGDLTQLEHKASKPSPGSLLKFGYITSGLGLGVFFGYIISTYSSLDTVVMMIAMPVLFAGLAAILAHNKLKNKETSAQ